MDTPDIKLVSYNLLAQRFVDAHYADILSSKTWLHWDSRLLKMKAKILAEDPDVILLQEVELSNFKADWSDLRDYDSFVHTISRKRNNPIGNAILWKKKFECLVKKSNSCSLVVELSPTPSLIPNLSRILLQKTETESGSEEASTDGGFRFATCISKLDESAA